ncbi:MAG: transglutaminase-like cysteine peptidase [Thiomicrospira sp.]
MRRLLGLGLWATLAWAAFAQNLASPPLFSAKELKQTRDKYGELAARRLLAWQALVQDNQDKPERLKLSLVNDFFSQATLSDDKTLWKKDDYWATPVEFLARDAGDAEDYVIAKYFTLIALGVDENKLYFTYVSSSRLRQAHMVLTYFRSPRAQPLILDSLTDRILKASERADLTPIYSFNAQGALAGQRQSDLQDSMHEWNRMLRRMRDGVVN